MTLTFPDTSTDQANLYQTISVLGSESNGDKIMSVKNIKPVEPLFPFEKYMHEMTPLSKEDGGGFMITFPDLPGCMSDGETIEEAIQNGRDAFIACISALVDMGRAVPPPSARAPAEIIK